MANIICMGITQEIISPCVAALEMLWQTSSWVRILGDPNSFRMPGLKSQFYHRPPARDSLGLYLCFSFPPTTHLPMSQSAARLPCLIS